MSELISNIKSFLKKAFYLVVVLVVVFLLIGITDYYESIGGFYYDNKYDNPSVESVQSLSSLLNEYPTLSFNELPASYKEESGYLKNAYKGMSDDLTFYLIPKEDRYRKIAGKNRINKLLPRKNNSVDDGLILGINVQVLHRFLALQERLDKIGYNSDALTIVSAYRPPVYNERIKGASQSRHMAGEAIDFTVGDVNDDGHYTSEDKEFVYQICDENIIGDNGGLGRYPGTRNLHIDVRGHRARWDTF